MTESREESQREEEEPQDPRKGGEGEEVMYPASHPDTLPKITPGRAGYDDRDPATDMPRVPSSPETQDD